MNVDHLALAANARAPAAAVPARAAVQFGAAVADMQAREAAAKAAAGHPASERMRQAVSDANRQLAQKGSELTFEFDDDVGRVIVKLVDTRTREVLRQIPSEEVLAIARALQDDAAAGALLRTDA